MIELNENVTREMNKYLVGTTIEEILIRNRKKSYMTKILETNQGF